MVLYSTIAIAIAIGMTMFLIGRHYQDFIFSLFGGLLIFLVGVVILINPIENAPLLLSQITGFIIFGLGAYLWVNLTILFIDENKFSTN
jgi:hypothetical protein